MSAEEALRRYAPALCRSIGRFRFEPVNYRTFAMQARKTVGSPRPIRTAYIKVDDIT